MIYDPKGPSVEYLEKVEGSPQLTPHCFLPHMSVSGILSCALALGPWGPGQAWRVGCFLPLLRFLVFSTERCCEGSDEWALDPLKSPRGLAETSWGKLGESMKSGAVP